MTEAMSPPPHQLILFVYAESEVIRLATVITPPRRSRFKHYDIRILTFMNIEAEECNITLSSNAKRVSFEYPQIYLNKKGKACKAGVNEWIINQI